jgi:hypothetical protein
MLLTRGRVEYGRNAGVEVVFVLTLFRALKLPPRVLLLYELFPRLDFGGG